jgi:hypothetical protein
MTRHPTLRRGSLVFLAATVIIAFSHVLRGAVFTSVVPESAAWAAAGAIVFSTWDWRRLRRGEHCAVCDGPIAPAVRD